MTRLQNDLNKVYQNLINKFSVQDKYHCKIDERHISSNRSCWNACS